MEKKLPTESIFENKSMDKTILTMSIPIIISMTVQSLYNIVDSIYVSYINEDALTSISICFPIQGLIIALGVGSFLGVGAVLSKSIGEKNEKKVNDLANLGLSLLIFLSLLFLIFSLFFTENYFSIQAVNENIKEKGIEYLKIITAFSSGTFLVLYFERMFSSIGKSKYTMITQITSAILNIILDPIFIFTFDLGVKGAAIATIISIYTGSLMGFYLYFKNITEFKLSLRKILLIDKIFTKKDTTPVLKYLKEIYLIGTSSIIINGLGSLVVFLFNQILSNFSSTHVAFFGIFFRIESFFILPCIGLANGMIPVVAYNFGARKFKRMILAVKKSFKYGLIFSIVGVIISELFPCQILRIFNASDNMLSIGKIAIMVITPSYILAAVNIIIASFFQAISKANLALIMSTSRQLLFLIPIAYIFGSRGNILMVWLSFTIAEFLCTVLGFYFFALYMKKGNLNYFEITD